MGIEGGFTQKTPKAETTGNAGAGTPEKAVAFAEIPRDMQVLHKMWRDRGGEFTARKSHEEITPELIHKEADRFKASFNKMRELFQEDLLRKGEGKPSMFPFVPNDMTVSGGEAGFRMRIAIGFAFMFAREHGVTVNEEVESGHMYDQNRQNETLKTFVIGTSANGTIRTRTEKLNGKEGRYETVSGFAADDDIGNSPLYEIRVRDEFLEYMDAF